MSINFVAEGVKKPNLSYRKVSEWIKVVILKYCLRPGDITFIFCDDNYLLDINIKFLDHDFFTDIVTFNYNEGLYVSGDLFISLERVMENSLAFNNSFEDELLRVIIHGILHLLKFEDSNAVEKVVMRRLEEECLEIYRNI